MTGKSIEFEKVYLKPGEMCFCQVPVLVTTILGSCVAVTMWSPRLGLAAICHAVQPVCPKIAKGCPEHCMKKYHYVSCVIPEMIHLMTSRGAMADELEVKLFGGAAVLATPASQSVGRQNIEMARSVLRDNGLRLKVHQVGGQHGRKLIFNTHTGEVLLKRIRYAESLRALQAETPTAGK